MKKSFKKTILFFTLSALLPWLMNCTTLNTCCGANISDGAKVSLSSQKGCCCGEEGSCPDKVWQHAPLPRDILVASSLAPLPVFPSADFLSAAADPPGLEGIRAFDPHPDNPARAPSRATYLLNATLLR